MADDNSQQVGGKWRSASPTFTARRFFLFLFRSFRLPIATRALLVVAVGLEEEEEEGGGGGGSTAGSPLRLSGKRAIFAGQKAGEMQRTVTTRWLLSSKHGRRMLAPPHQKANRLGF